MSQNINIGSISMNPSGGIGHVLVANSNAPTGVSWVPIAATSIQGHQGTIGNQGHIGTQGVQGIRGPTGYAGPTGPTGATGFGGCTGFGGPGQVFYSKLRNFKEYFLRETKSHKFYNDAVEMGIMCLCRVDIPNEILDEIVNKISKYVVCSVMKFTRYDQNKDIKECVNLPPRYTKNQLDTFLNKIDFYQSDFDIRNYSGMIWYDDKTWSVLKLDNKGYDMWRHFCPPIYYDEVNGV